MPRLRRYGNKESAWNVISYSHRCVIIIFAVQIIAGKFFRVGTLRNTAPGIRIKKNVYPAGSVASCLYHHIILLSIAAANVNVNMKQAWLFQLGQRLNQFFET